MQKLKMSIAIHWRRIVAFTLVLIFLVCSLTVFAKTFTDPQTYSKTIRSIDEKKITVLGVSAAIAGSATLLATVPDDATTPVANKLMDLSTYLLIVVCVLVLEKSLLTVFGAISCYILFPIACVFALVYIVKKQQSLAAWALKLAVLALALLTIVPTAMQISDYIYEVNQVTIEQQAEEEVSPSDSEAENTQTTDDRPWYQKLWDSVTNAVDEAVETVSNAVDAALEKGKAALNQFTDAVAVFVIAYCAIPISIVLLFLWLLKILFGIKIDSTRLPKKKAPAAEEKDLVLVD